MNNLLLLLILLISFILVLLLVDVKRVFDSFTKKQNKNVAIVISSLLGIGFIIISLFSPYFFTDISNNKLKPNEVGDTMGGTMSPFVAVAGVIFTFLAFYIQKLANDEIKDQFKTQKFESQFYEMLKLHKENVNELKLESDKKVYENREVLKFIFYDFIECYRELGKFSDSTEINDYLQPMYAKKLHEITKDINSEINLIELAKIDIAYSIVFFGLSKDGESILIDNFKKKYNKKYYYKLLFFLKFKPCKEGKDEFIKWLNFRDLSCEKLNKLIEKFYPHRHNLNNLNFTDPFEANCVTNYFNKEKYYKGHQFRLSHYFRHLFHLFKHIDSNINNDIEAYNYGKVLRAQLSTYEQFLLFVNSLSSIGMKWEYLSKKKNTHNLGIITKYQLIKNLPGEHIYGIRFKKFYPKIKFESDDNTF